MIANFDVDSTGRVLDFKVNESPDGSFNRQLVSVLRTYRFRAHSMYDPDLYREKTEVEDWRHADPIPALTASLTRAGAISTGDVDAWEGEVAAELAAAIAAADAAPVEPVEDLERYLTTEPGAAGPGVSEPGVAGPGVAGQGSSGSRS